MSPLVRVIARLKPDRSTELFPKVIQKLRVSLNIFGGKNMSE